MINFIPTSDEGQALIESARQAVQGFSNFMVRFSDKVGFKYYPPKKLKT